MSEKVLVVEDDTTLLETLEYNLARQGYKVLATGSATEALAALEENDGPVHLLLTDVVMPEMNGKQMFEILAQKCPDLKVLYMSGYTNNVIAHRGVLDEGVNFIQKPFTVQALVIKVREVLDDNET